MMKKLLFRSFNLIAALLFAATAWSQTTTSTIVGVVTNAKGESLPGAAVVAIHTPSGSAYGSVTNIDGRYTISNCRVGGPYEIKISFVGYETQKVENVFLKLGEKFAQTATLKESSSTLEEFVVKAGINDPINNKRTGASTNISNEQLQSLPTIGRNAADFTRLTPASTDGGSFAGRSAQYNNFSLDGTIFNNPFGLDAATPGGQTDAAPVSLDAIEQIQVSLAPYDVTQSGFTGASINAVTKSGTNEVKGTAFGFFRNQDMVSRKVGDTKLVKADLNQFQGGFAIGLPIIKNKLFLFANAEISRRTDLGTTFVAARPGLTGANVSRVTAADLDAVSKALKDNFGYETGAYEGYLHQTNNTKAILKLDWNISQDHKFALTYNTLNASKDKPANPAAIGRRGPDATTLQFRNSGYTINNKIQSVIGELRSSFGSIASNKLQGGVSSFRDTRDPFSTPFPVVSIGKDNIRYIVAGHEPFSIYNRLDQDVFQINDNFNLYLGKHTLTVGAAFEKFSFDNSFNLNTYDGTFGDIANVAAFLDSVKRPGFKKIVDGANATFNANSKNELGWNWSYVNVGQISAYIQDEFQVSNNFTLTYGVRLDKPSYFDTKDSISALLKKSCCYVPDATYYDAEGKATKLDQTVLPTTKALISPRIGFNWNVSGDGKTQLRGGSGLFTGRFPFVWIGNQAGNPNFFFRQMTDPSFQFPQVWRSNLGFEKKLNGGWLVSADAIYTKDINAMMVRDYGLNKPTGTLNSPFDKRPAYKITDRTSIFGGPASAYVFTNNNIGNSTNLTLEVKRNWAGGLYTSLGYNYGLSFDASSISAEISSDAYDRNPAYGNVNTAVSAPSLYGNLHRFVGVAAKKYTYGKMATTVSAFFQAAKGGRFSYTYSGDINGDGSGNNDLMFIPTDAQLDQMTFSGAAAQAAEQKAAFKAFIAQDDYLNANRGAVVEKYGLLSPWYSSIDLRILQDFNFNVSPTKTNTVQISLDLLNLGNLVSSKWGVRQNVVNTQPVGVSVNAAGVPVYSFDKALTKTFVDDFSLASRWQLQLGARYIF
jgi:Carboxypeptidase regulatory-like domain/TonB dependent receptor